MLIWGISSSMHSGGCVQDRFSTTTMLAHVSKLDDLPPFRSTFPACAASVTRAWQPRHRFVCQLGHTTFKLNLKALLSKKAIQNTCCHRITHGSSNFSLLQHATILLIFSAGASCTILSSRIIRSTDFGALAVAMHIPKSETEE